MNVARRYQILPDGLAERAFLRIRKKALQRIRRRLAGVEETDIGADVGRWGMAIGFARFVEVPIMQTVGGAGVDSILYLS